MKNRLIALTLAAILALSVFSGICIIANAEEGESPNLFELYGANPHFDDGVAPWKSGGTGSTIEQYDEDSADDDGYCALITGRTTNYSVARFTGADPLTIVNDQGDGTYYYSFYVKCKNKNASCKIRPVWQLSWGGSYSEGAAKNGSVIGAWPYGDKNQYAGIDVNGKEWTKIEMTYDLALSNQGKSLAQLIFYSTQADFSADNAPDLLFDDMVLIKKTGGWKNVTPIPDVDIPSQRQVNKVQRSDSTGIGAVYYHAWYKSMENWWLEEDNTLAASMRESSTQEARCLSPAAYHYRIPFFGKVNNVVVEDEFENGCCEFPEFTFDIWKREIELMDDCGIDFVAYLWSEKNVNAAGAYQYHIQNKGLGKLKMCAILQSMDQDLNAMADAMTEDYWYCVDGMPVVYIYGGKDVCTEEFVRVIRKKVALAQYAKNGEVGEPAYIIAQGLNSYSAAMGCASRGLDATGWYAISASGVISEERKAEWHVGDPEEEEFVKRQTFKELASGGLKMMENTSQAYTALSISPVITLGYNTEPRLQNPTSWMTTDTTSGLCYNGYTVEDPTPEEITQNVLDVLNWNKKNTNKFFCNTVLIYCWNEYDEGGWFAPTLACDAQGNVLKNADGSNKLNYTYFNAVKRGISLYRSHEAEKDAIYDINDNLIEKFDISTPTPEPTRTPKPKATEAPEEEEITWTFGEILADIFAWNVGDEIHYFSNLTRVIIWIAGLAVIAGIVVLVLFIIKKKKKKAAEPVVENSADGNTAPAGETVETTEEAPAEAEDKTEE